MNPEYIESKDFKGENFIGKGFRNAEYENCTFTDCIYANTDLSRITFSECQFEGCDLSMSKLISTSFRDVSFINCKLMGLRFDECTDFLLSFNFEACILNFSSFFKLKLKEIKFNGDYCKINPEKFLKHSCGIADRYIFFIHISA